MQFIKSGPDIPERLLQQHEEGRVVFFCGAGISYPAGLPGFGKLVDRIFTELGIVQNDVEKSAIKAQQFDTAIGLLEARIAGGRETVRQTLPAILKPDLSLTNAMATHKALLTLGKTRDNRTRLITTNFDRLFEEVINRKSIGVKHYSAPLLPVPKNRWDGLIYLHGLLSENPTPNELDHLVASSGDFGLAYLTERWAARFVSELLRNYTVCFVGYSINDQVLRYMMDALAADRLLGESMPEMFAFGSFRKGQEKEQANEWQTKSVTPILYKEHRHHYYLHKTLRVWAETYRDGISGKERIVVDYALARPMASTKQDDYVGRLLWALSDPQGLPAKRFADFNPVPSLDWLETLCNERYRHDDLERFGISPKPKKDADLIFSLLRRPAPYDLAKWMTPVDAGFTRSRFDPVMSHLVRWLTRHLDDPALLLWVVKHGAQLHDEFVLQIENQLREIDKLERDSKQEELKKIRLNAPNAIPRPAMRTLWQFILTGRVKSLHHRQLHLFNWINHFNQNGLTPTVRLELREMLTPRISLREPYRWHEEQVETKEPERPNDLVDLEIVLTTDNVHHALENLSENQQWQEALPDLLSDFSMLLKDMLELMHQLDGIDEKSDRSYWDQPSISHHPQNNKFHERTALIDLARDAWLATAKINPLRAHLTAENWWQTPSPLFKRLSFFAATHNQIIPPTKALEWFLADDSWWVWTSETKREAIRLLVNLATNLNPEGISRLEKVILNGPPREMYKSELKPEQWTLRMEKEVWLRLAKMAAVDRKMGTRAQERLAELSNKHPQWQIAEDDKDEFPYWLGEVRVGDRDPWKEFIQIPRGRDELVTYLRQYPVPEQSKQDDWRQLCQEKYSVTLYALCTLSKENIWPVDRWSTGLISWSAETRIKRSWHYMAPILDNAPDEFLKSLDHSLSQWLKNISKKITVHEPQFLNLCLRILAMDHPNSGEIDHPVGRAINHPVGIVTDALLNWWYKKSPEDGQSLPEELTPIFSEICNTNIEKFRHGRVLLSAHVIALFRVDKEWTTENLLPLFEWQRSPADALSAWKSFLWSPRLYHPLIAALKIPFLETVNHFESLDDYKTQYARFLAYVALNPGDICSNADLATATGLLPPEGLHEAAEALVSALESAGDQRSEYWTNRILPYLRSIWPRSGENISSNISESFAMLCIEAQEAFPEAVKVLRHWLQPLDSPDYIVHRLHESEICIQSPEPALSFLDLLIQDDRQYPPSELGNCLEKIVRKEPQLATNNRFQRLKAYLRLHGKD